MTYKLTGLPHSFSTKLAISGSIVIRRELLLKRLLPTSMVHAVVQSSSSSFYSSAGLSKTSSRASNIVGPQLRSEENCRTRLRFLDSYPRNPIVRLKVVMESPGLAKEMAGTKPKVAAATKEATDHFKELRQKFLCFKKDKYLSNVEHYQRLSESQSPKFMVIACADSRVCPSSILGFQPGEAFVVRNVANLVPPHENGPSETNAALEFAVNSLEVENILVVGHSCCGGIKALMSLQDEPTSSFITSWVLVGGPAKLKTRAAVSNLNFDQQCRYCEKESINRSLMNLLTYPWIEERVMRGKLSIHGGYYDFIDCSFEKWTLDFIGSNLLSDGGCCIKNREFWA